MISGFEAPHEAWPGGHGGLRVETVGLPIWHWLLLPSISMVAGSIDPSQSQTGSALAGTLPVAQTLWG